jgi:hypothetical protein
MGSFDPLNPPRRSLRIKGMEQGQTVTLESVLAQARQLSTSDKVRLMEAVLPEIATTLETRASKGLRSCHGLFSDLGTPPSSEDIDEIRKEMFGNFPRADAA